MLTGWTGRKWDAGRLERSTAPKGSSRMGLSTSCARRRPRPQAGHGFSYAVNSSFPHRNLKFNLVVSADWRTIQRQLKLQRIQLEQDVPLGDLLIVVNQYLRDDADDVGRQPDHVSLDIRIVRR